MYRLITVIAILMVSLTAGMAQTVNQVEKAVRYRTTAEKAELNAKATDEQLNIHSQKIVMDKAVLENNAGAQLDELGPRAVCGQDIWCNTEQLNELGGFHWEQSTAKLKELGPNPFGTNMPQLNELGGFHWEQSTAELKELGISHLQSHSGQLDELGCGCFGRTFAFSSEQLQEFGPFGWNQNMQKLKELGPFGWNQNISNLKDLGPFGWNQNISHLKDLGPFGWNQITQKLKELGPFGWNQSVSHLKESGAFGWDQNADQLKELGGYLWNNTSNQLGELGCRMAVNSNGGYGGCYGGSN